MMRVCGCVRLAFIFRLTTQTTRGTRLMMGMASVIDPIWIAMSTLEHELGTKSQAFG